MKTVNITQLRQNLKLYLDLLEQGEKIQIIRNSVVIGTINPAFPKPKKSRPEPVTTHQLKDGRQVIIRRWRSADRLVVQELHERALKAAGAYGDPTKDWDLDAIETVYFDELLPGEFLVGELEGEVVAMGGFKWMGERAEVKRLRVKPELQGQGLGSRLLEVLEDKARNKGFKAVTLDATTADGQSPAQHLYNSRGYQETDRYKSGGLEIICYRKSL